MCSKDHWQNVCWLLWLGGCLTASYFCMRSFQLPVSTKGSQLFPILRQCIFHLTHPEPTAIPVMEQVILNVCFLNMKQAKIWYTKQSEFLPREASNTFF